VDRLKRRAATMFIGAQALALLTPAYIVLVEPRSAVYHWNILVLLTQIIPYSVCASIWLPSRNENAPKIAFWLSALLLAAAGLWYAPMWLHPRSGGDMAGLGYILVCLVTTIAILGISLVAFLVTWWSGRNRR
jgi:hypothetical protein